MFTGLIEEVGSIASVSQNASGSRITVYARTVLENVKLGDSIAIDGACTTVVAFDAQGFTIEASPETLEKTNFSQFKPGFRVNLERPLTPSSRIGGHYVTGHIDGQAILRSRKQDGLSHIFAFELDSAELAEYVVSKGSIAVSGISLTVNQVQDRQFSVAIIPHTLSHTNLDERRPGDRVNIETDLLGKYVKKFLSASLNHQQPKDGLQASFLMEHGFIPAQP